MWWPSQSPLNLYGYLFQCLFQYMSGEYWSENEQKKLALMRNS